MDFNGVPVFVKVVQLGSITAAAKALNMPITTASSQLMALEKRLGVTLIQRSTRKLHITEAGHTYYNHCLTAILALENAESALATSREIPQGHLRLTLPPDISNHLLPPLLVNYLARYPEVSVEVVSTYRVVDFLTEGIDLGLRAGNLKDSSLIARTFFDLKVAFWAAPTYLENHGTPRSLTDLAHHQFVSHRSMLDGIVLRQGDQQEQLKLPPSRIHIDDFESIKALVVLGQGIALLPRYLAYSEWQAGRLIQVLPDWQWPSLPLRFVYPAQRFVSLTVRSFMEHCLTEIQNAPFLD